MGSLVEAGLVKWYKERFINLTNGGSPGTESGIWVGAGCLQTPCYESGLERVKQFIERNAGDISIIVKPPLTIL
jgi:hypothetical protein